jgi:hypothetical protein
MKFPTVEQPIQAITLTARQSHPLQPPDQMCEIKSVVAKPEHLKDQSQCSSKKQRQARYGQKRLAPGLNPAPDQGRHAKQNDRHEFIHEQQERARDEVGAPNAARSIVHHLGDARPMQNRE